MKQVGMLRLVLSKSILILVGVSMTSVFAARAEAEPRTHDGFFLQVDAGVGGMASSEDGGRNDYELSGAAGQFAVTVGGAVRKNLIVAGQAWAVAADDPDLEVNGNDAGDVDATLTLSGVGLNITYYLPSNIYFSVTPSITKLELDSDDYDAETDTGFGLRLAVGKEWWVSDSWGLGLNGQVILSSNEDDGDTWNTGWVGIAFSATFN